jgi:hypothetical protein
MIRALRLSAEDLMANAEATTPSGVQRVQDAVHEIYPLVRREWLAWVNHERKKLNQEPLDGTDVPPVPVTTTHPGVKSAYRTYLSDPTDTPQQSAIALPTGLAESASPTELAQVVTMALADIFADRQTAIAYHSASPPSRQLKDELRARLNTDGDGIPQWRRSGPSPLGLLAIGENPRLLAGHAGSVASSLAMTALESVPGLETTHERLQRFQQGNPDLQKSRMLINRFLHQTTIGRFIDKTCGWFLRPTLLRPFLKETGPGREEIFGAVLQQEQPSTPPVGATRERPRPQEVDPSPEQEIGPAMEPALPAAPRGHAGRPPPLQRVGLA